MTFIPKERSQWWEIASNATNPGPHSHRINLSPAKGIPLIITFLPIRWYLASIICFIISFVMVLEAIMSSLLRYTSCNLMVGKSKDVIFVRDCEWPTGYTIVCVPIFLRVRLWAVDDISVSVSSGDKKVDTVPYRHDGQIDDVDNFKLDWYKPREIIAIAYSDATNVLIGTPIWHKYLNKKDRYTIKLNVSCKGKLIRCVEYNFLHEDMKYLNGIGGKNNATP